MLTTQDQTLGYNAKTDRPVYEDPPLVRAALAGRRTIQIEPLLHGFIVRVGCQTVAFEKIENMVKELERYFKNPESVEAEYLGLKKAK